MRAVQLHEYRRGELGNRLLSCVLPPDQPTVEPSVRCPLDLVEEHLHVVRPQNDLASARIGADQGLALLSLPGDRDAWPPRDIHQRRYLRMSVEPPLTL
jgi:hypothetical protein